jgi:hypothetical protein
MKTEQILEIEKQIKKKIRRRIKLFGLLFAGCSLVMYLNRYESQIARKLYFDKLFNNNECEETDSENNFVLFY